MLAGHGKDGITGQQPDESEGTDGDADQRRQHQDDFVEEISEHLEKGAALDCAPPA
jgi:hypothetical protein